MNKFDGYTKVIQGGMGANISCPKLARTVSMESKSGAETLGTISGVTLERMMARILQIGGDLAHDLISALKDFPISGIKEKIINEYSNNPKKGVPVFSVNPSRSLIMMTICANYAFVKMAKRGHNGLISINYLEKIAMPHLFSIFGAMLAGVDFITMGAGIPLGIPAVINAYANNMTATYKIPVVGENDYEMSFNPAEFFEQNIPSLEKPGFIPIIASNVLAVMMKKKLPEGSIYGFVIEEPTAGGHNAPPRNKTSYGVKDVVDYQEIANLGLPFWIGGSYASPEKLKHALSVGACGIQAGSIFALSRESGMRPDLRQEIINAGLKDEQKIRTDMRISPTGFPFKVVQLEGTISESHVYEARKRVCDVSVLVHAYKRPDGSIGYRCPSEPVSSYLKKGGKLEDTLGRGCVCNGLITTAGLRFQDEDEPSIVTLGDDVSFLKDLIEDQNQSYSAVDALNYLFRR